MMRYVPEAVVVRELEKRVSKSADAVEVTRSKLEWSQVGIASLIERTSRLDPNVALVPIEMRRDETRPQHAVWLCLLPVSTNRIAGSGIDCWMQRIWVSIRPYRCLPRSWLAEACSIRLLNTAIHESSGAMSHSLAHPGQPHGFRYNGTRATRDPLLAYMSLSSHLEPEL